MPNTLGSISVVVTFFDVIPYVVIGALVVVAWWVCILQMDVFTPAEVRAWRTLTTLRGYQGPEGALERLATRSAFFGKIQKRLDLARLLPIANINMSPTGFLGSAAAKSIVGALVFLALEAMGIALYGSLLFPPGYIVIVFFGTMLFIVLRLKSKATRKQYLAGKTLADMLMMVAIMTDGRGLQPEDAVRILSHCASDSALEEIVGSQGWTRLIKQPHKSTAELYKQIGDQFDIPMFNMIADALLNTNVGMAERDTFTTLAKICYERRLTDAKMDASRAKILVTLPVAGMLIPLLVLIGFPAFQSITAGV